jgi:hypothetical protein
MKIILLFSGLLFVCGLNAFAQQRLYEPKRDSAERKALMNAIREYDTKRDAKLKDETFNVTALRVQGNWAYANVEQNLPEGVQSYGVAHVFLQKAGGKWKVAFSTYNDTNEVGVEGLERLKRNNRSFPRQLTDFAMNYLAG